MSKRPFVPEDLKSLAFLSDPQLSPDGSTVIYAQGKLNEKNSLAPQIWAVDMEAGEAKQLTQHEKGQGQARWSPCGGWISFVSGRGGSAQIWLMPWRGGEAKALSKLDEGSIGETKWSPDGRWIAFTYRPTHPDRTSKAKKERDEKGLSTPAWEIETLWYRLDGDGYFGQQRYAIHLIEVGTGETKEIYSAGKLGSYGFDWLPDSSALAVIRAASDNPLIDEPSDQVYLVGLDGSEKQVTNLISGGRGNPAVSPCGGFVSYLANLDAKDVWGVRNSRLYVLDLKSGAEQCLTLEEPLCLDAATLTDTSADGSTLNTWSRDGSKIYVKVAVQGTVQLGSVDVKHGGLTLHTEGQHVLGFGGFSADGTKLGITRGTPTQVSEIGVISLGETTEIRELTSVNQEFLATVELAEPEELWLDSTGGTRVQAWVMRPSKGGITPGILEVHGGPHTQYGLGFFVEFQSLVSAGYTVVFSNPRGSKGYSEEHTAAIERDWGNADWDDIQTVTNWMLNDPHIDSNRVAIMGGSYGGYMTNWAVGHSDVYKTAITDRCVSNWVSMAGNSDFPLARDDYFGGYAWGDLEKIREMWRQSPISYFDKVRTPMLVIHSEGDFRCNVEQGEQVFHALQAQGIKSKFIRYPVETSHGLSRTGPVDLRIHRIYSILSWYQETL